MWTSVAVLWKRPIREPRSPGPCWQHLTDSDQVWLAWDWITLVWNCRQAGSFLGFCLALLAGPR